MSPYATLRQRFLARLPATDPAMETAMLRVCVYIGNQPDAQAAVLQLIAAGCAVPVVEDLVTWLEAHCGDLMAELRGRLADDKLLAATAGVGVAPVLARLQREFLADGR
jgi:hypothetical protein